jgi:hypothetical protein
MDPNAEMKHPGVLMAPTICRLSVTFQSLVHPPSTGQHLNLMKPGEPINQQYAIALKVRVSISRFQAQ